MARAALAMVLLLMACSAWAFEVKPKVRQDAYSGATVVWISPHGGACKIKDGGCLTIGWQWSSDRPDEVQMQLQVLYVRSPIDGGMVSVDGVEIPISPFNEVTTYDGPNDPIHAIGYSQKYFKLPLDLARKMKSGEKVWVFANTHEGSFRDRLRGDGKETKAAGALDRFLAEVDKHQQ